MPKDESDVRQRLQSAALQLFRDQGYEQTTAAGIAAAAGVTERTFFRYFPDKREVLFDGEQVLAEALTKALQGAPTSLKPWGALLFAFQSVLELFVENRAVSLPRRQVIAGSPALQERALAKERVLVATLVAALQARGVAAPRAQLAAQVGMAALSQAFNAWIEEDSGDLRKHLLRAFRDVHNLTSKK